jgi:hypothetical protein
MPSTNSPYPKPKITWRDFSIVMVLLVAIVASIIVLNLKSTLAVIALTVAFFVYSGVTLYFYLKNDPSRP